MKPWNSIPRSAINQPNGVAGLDAVGQMDQPLPLAASQLLRPLTINTPGELWTAVSPATSSVAIVADAAVPGGRAIECTVDNSAGGTQLDRFFRCKLLTPVAVRTGITMMVKADNAAGIIIGVTLSDLDSADPSESTSGWRADFSPAVTHYAKVDNEYMTLTAAPWFFTARGTPTAWYASLATDATYTVRWLWFRMRVDAGLTRTVRFSPVYWQQPASAGIVIQFDDGRISQYDRAFPILRERGLVGTVWLEFDNLGTAGYMTVDNALEMQDAGWDMCVHSPTHIVEGMSDDNTRDVIQTAQLRAIQLGFSRGCRFWLPAGNLARNPISQNIVNERFLGSRGASRYTDAASTVYPEQAYTLPPSWLPGWYNRGWHQIGYQQFGGLGATNSPPLEFGAVGEDVLPYLQSALRHRMVGSIYTHSIIDDPALINVNGSCSTQYMTDLADWVAEQKAAGTMVDMTWPSWYYSVMGGGAMQPAMREAGNLMCVDSGGRRLV